jgi:hypothetical protein
VVAENALVALELEKALEHLRRVVERESQA